MPPEKAQEIADSRNYFLNKVFKHHVIERIFLLRSFQEAVRVELAKNGKDVVAGKAMRESWLHHGIDSYVICDSFSKPRWGYVFFFEFNAAKLTRVLICCIIVHSLQVLDHKTFL